MVRRGESDLKIAFKPAALWVELTWMVLILIVGIMPRFVFVMAFPTQPVSDFRRLLNFALHLRDDIFARGTEYWRLFSPGLPTALSILLRLNPDSPELVARLATASLMGIMPILPFIIWRGVFSMRVRISAALLLALWPGQILFSGVVAQDNWVIFPTVALAALAIRSAAIERRGGYPVAAAVLYVGAVSIRQEMMIILLPIALVAAVGWARPRLRSNLIFGVLLAGLLLLALAIQRGVGSGRFALTTEHGGRAILGAYVPGAGIDYWVNPNPYIATVEPSLLEEGADLQWGMFRLIGEEILRRPRFHLVRILAAALNGLFRVDTGNLYWSLTSPEVLLSDFGDRIDSLLNIANPLLRYYPLAVHAVFLASIFFAIWQRGRLFRLAGLIGITVLLKISLHAVTVAQPRYFLVVVALELLTIAIVMDEAVKPEWRLLFLGWLVMGIVIATCLFMLLSSAETFILSHDDVGFNNFIPLSRDALARLGDMASMPGQGIWGANDWPATARECFAPIAF